MTKIHTTILAVLLSFIATTASAQTDAENMDQARKALDGPHKCDEAMRSLNLVSPGSRLSADYLLCMARTQDCMQNSEQALYYYNKYLGLKPTNDSVKKRAAELTDTKNRNARVAGEERKAQEIYGTAAKRRKHRRINLDDNYYSFGMGYGLALGGNKAPYKSAFGFHISDGFMIINNHALLDLSYISNFLVSPNATWVNSAVAPINTGAPAGRMRGGFSQVFTMGISPVIINNKDISLTAGLIGGINYYMFPMSVSENYPSVELNNSITFCYGIKSNLYIGQNLIIFANLLLHPTNSADVSSSYISYTVPVSYNMLNFGAAVKIDSWW